MFCLILEHLPKFIIHELSCHACVSRSYDISSLLAYVMTSPYAVSVDSYT